MNLDFDILNKNDLAELDTYIDQFEDKEGNLIAILHRAQSIVGYLPAELQVYIARKTGIPTAKIYGVVSFYSFFTMKPRGKHTLSVCMGTACFVKGAEDVLDEIKKQLKVDLGELTKDGMFLLEQVHCLGACSLAPVIAIDGKVYGNMTRDKVKKIIESYYITTLEGDAAHVN